MCDSVHGGMGEVNSDSGDQGLGSGDTQVRSLDTVLYRKPVSGSKQGE